MVEPIPNPYTIDAKPTEYKSFTYKSKLEAQHAKFFDLLGVDFFYEPEWFDFGTVLYLPDFKVFMPSGERWVEVKGPMYKLARVKAKLLCKHTMGLVQVWVGSWGSQIIYNFEWYEGRVRISKSKYLDGGFEYWTRKELREAYESAREV